MKFNVRLLAFGKENEFRVVDVPDDHILEDVFNYGQNDFQASNQPSVSVGDVIELPDGDLYLVRPVGFRKISNDELLEIQKMSME